jgi:hypothetical protein
MAREFSCRAESRAKFQVERERIERRAVVGECERCIEVRRRIETGRAV